jgi:hypothetical protein
MDLQKIFPKTFLIPLLASLLLLLAIAFVDEGHYNFSFLKDPSSILTLVIYFLALAFGQAIVHFLILGHTKTNYKALLSFIGGIPIALELLAVLAVIALRK